MRNADAERIEALERENESLKLALEEALEANRAKSRFLSNMSHDIRTPMNAIMGMTSIGLAHIDEKTRVQDCLNKINTASLHLMGLVNDVLDMARIDSGHMSVNEEAFSLADLIHDISVILQPQADVRRQDFRMEIEQNLAENLLGDELHLRQILLNIIGNAVKYTPEEGKIRVHFSQRKEGESASGEQVVWLDIECRDTGIGMSPEFLEKLGSPFERVRNDFTSKVEGTGLGMSIVKNLVEHMNGVLEVESEEGVGSRFVVRLPFRVAEFDHQSLALPKGAVVLVAENCGEDTRQIADFLEQGGLLPVCLDTGLRVVTWLTEAQYEGELPCALVLGEELTDISVIDLAAHVRQLTSPEFPILLVSGKDWTPMEYRAVRAGVNAFVPRPLFAGKLLTTLSQQLEGQNPESPYAKPMRDFGDRRILLVDDVELNLEIVVEILSATGVKVETAENGAEAVEKFASSPEGYYDLIFMDVQMPVMDGYEATGKIRRLERADAQTIWIVAMTANAFAEDVRQERNAGMNDHISKPINPDRLQEILLQRFA